MQGGSIGKGRFFLVWLCTCGIVLESSMDTRGTHAVRAYVRACVFVFVFECWHG